MNEIQQATLHFFGPITVAYSLAAVLLLSIDRFFPFQKTGEKMEGPSKPVQEVMVGLMVGLAVLAIGNFLRIDKVWKPVAEPWAGFWWILTNAEIYAPIFIVMVVRRQPLATVFLSRHQLFVKVLGGVAAAIICSAVFLLIRGELHRLPEVLVNTTRWSSIKNFPAVFLEGVAVAFVFVRLVWLLGARWATVLPSLFFAAAHVPGAWQQGEPVASIAGFFVINTGLCMMLLYSCAKTRDILFLGVVHYVMDVTIKSF